MIMDKSLSQGMPRPVHRSTIYAYGMPSRLGSQTKAVN
jgi:hypothetical protein